MPKPDESRRIKKAADLGGTFESIERKLRELGSPKATGTAFEVLCRDFLLKAPQYKGLFADVWVWREWPGHWGIDKGIDLVAETVDGRRWAIQAKAVHPDRTIPKRELDSFLSESNRPEFDYRLIIATTDNVGRNARHTIDGQEKPVGLVLRGDLLRTPLKWPPHIRGKPRPLPKKTPHLYQAVAIRDVKKGFRNSDRGQLIMACGTGKTLVALWIAERLTARRVLVLVPSLSLISQTLTEWASNCRRPFDCLVVCSDETVTRRGKDHAVMSTRELGIPVTTNVDDIRRFLSRKRQGRSGIVLCTYQSSDRIALAQDQSLSASFDLVVADEAHRCTGRAGSVFSTVLDASKIKANKRLFMTATPRYFTGRVKKRAGEFEYELASMDDKALFGPVFHQLTFGAAIHDDLLTDYQVVVIGVTGSELRKWVEAGRLVRTKDGLETDARTLATRIGLAKAIRKYDLHKIITFHSSVAKAKRLADPAFEDSLAGVIGRMPNRSRPSGQLWTEHISGMIRAGKRSTLLDVFGKLPIDTRGVLSNCACLGEGVDVPVLDGVAFLDPKRSMVDIIQAVGRVIRKAVDKRIGAVVVPVFVDESEDAEHALATSAFEPVWQVLRALRAHDTRLADELDELRSKLGKQPRLGKKVRLPPKIKVDIPTLLLKDFVRAFHVRTVEKTTGMPPLIVDYILAWADAYYECNGQWPTRGSGEVTGAPGETWNAIEQALYGGGRGLPGGSSLAKLLHEYGRRRNPRDLPSLTVDQILSWADKHRKRTGKWPRHNSGHIGDARGETWKAINHALRLGMRSLPGDSSLARLLKEHRDARSHLALPKLTIRQILEWADLHRKRTGDWPNRKSGAISVAPEEKWANVDAALQSGGRGLGGRSSLAQLLAEHRGVRNRSKLENLSCKRILEWADRHFERTGRYPNQDSGEVAEAPGEEWVNIDTALRQGFRGLPGGSSLSQLLKQERDATNSKNRPNLTLEQILAWSDLHHKRTGEWPKATSGQVVDARKESWSRIDAALRQGQRGLIPGSSLPQLLKTKRDVRNLRALPDLTEAKVFAWAEEHYRRMGEWPHVDFGPVVGNTAETWRGINRALTNGSRGLPGGVSLARFLQQKCGVVNPQHKPPLTIEQILAWAKEHKTLTGQWPNKRSGAVYGNPNEKWSSIDAAINQGHRGLAGGSTLAQLLRERYPSTTEN